MPGLHATVQHHPQLWVQMCAGTDAAWTSVGQVRQYLQVFTSHDLQAPIMQESQRLGQVCAAVFNPMDVLVRSQTQQKLFRHG